MKWPPEVVDYNKRFTKTLQKIKQRHDPVVTTMGKKEFVIESYSEPC